MRPLRKPSTSKIRQSNAVAEHSDKAIDEQCRLPEISGPEREVPTARFTAHCHEEHRRQAELVKSAHTPCCQARNDGFVCQPDTPGINQASGNSPSFLIWVGIVRIDHQAWA